MSYEKITKDHVIIPELIKLLRPDMESALRWHLQKQFLKAVKESLSSHMPDVQANEVTELLKQEMLTMTKNKKTQESRTKFYYELGKLANYFSPDSM